MLEKAEITIENLMSKIKYYYPTDIKTIMEAFDLAVEAHKGQVRSSGRPYITHPTVVCDILAEMGFDVPTLCAALLHDTVEDTYVTDELLRAKFGDEVADLVKGVTKLDKIQFINKEEEQAENIRKMFFAMAKDIRVLIIKLADRLHNMRSLQFLPPARQIIFAKETRDIFAPLAGRLGISPIKCELEDLALKYLDTESYEYLADNIVLKKDERQNLVDTVIRDINNLLAEIEVKGEVSGRTKHFYSIYKKMKNQGKTLEQIYDLTAVRIMVESVKDCYNVLGEIHAKWKPIPGRFKDYIAVPKPNLYQSLHTTVVTSVGVPFEIQIRTEKMHRVAEYGIAAHWKYKEGQTAEKINVNDKLEWVKDVLSYEGDLKNSSEFLDIIRKDLSITNEVYVFTPKGDVRNLTAGATALDFAYAVHSEVGNKCVGAKLNSKICPLETEVMNGDVIEVLTNPNSKGPSRDWLKIVKTAGAKAKIRQFFKRELKDEYIKNGKSMLDREAKHRGYNLSALMSTEAIKAVFDRYLFESLDEMYASIGYGGISVNQIIPKLAVAHRNLNEVKIAQSSTTSNPQRAKSRDNSVVVKGFDDLLIRFSKCCAPVPGDSILGYISRGRGITIHRADCPSVKGLETERLVDASWANSNSANATFISNIQIVSEDKGEVFAEITKVIANEKLPILAINARKDKNHNAVAVISVEITNHAQLELMMDKLRALPNTIQVFRTTN